MYETDNTYDGILTIDQVRCVTALATTMGYRGPDIDDVLQEVAIAVWSTEFDPDRGCRNTFVMGIARKTVLLLTRTERRYREALRRYAEKVMPSMDVSEEANDDLVISDVVDHLTENERELCDLLLIGMPKVRICQWKDCGRRQLDREIDELRQRLIGLGFSMPGWTEE